MHATVVLNVVGLTPSLLPHAPTLRSLGVQTRLRPVLPAVTTSVQSSMLTGLPVGGSSGGGGHGIVGNGWYDRERCEIRFWERSNRLVQGEKVWETAKQRDAAFTCANLFWWYNSYSTCDYIVQARPIYKADGRKIPDCYSEPYSLRDRLQSELGTFPLFKFWGPLADITSTRWIAEAAKRVFDWHSPTLSLVYLPHLDYPLQKLGPGHPDIPKHVALVDEVVRDLVHHFHRRDVRVIVVSEYGIEMATDAIDINRHLRQAGLLRVRDEDGHEMLDPGASDAFAVADHQVAHVYRKPGTWIDMGEYARLFGDIPGVARVEHIDHERAGDFVLVAQPGHWFTYDYWLDEAKAPDFARTVAIHRKPGYDPRELFSEATRLEVAWKLAKRKLGFRQLLDVVPLDTALVRGTHGRPDLSADLSPLLITPEDQPPDADELPCTAVRDVILDSIFGR